ncbi:cell division protein FtsQ/DivIB [Nereida sp. MMG025]|uniref:cell division protein FtsQ/DivIB n=1 Tax=Nereida sp. MMG025 TaxID=2909981 RepID=UPI001F4533D4|nr:cell division protein FtsQ/DivIB [Nereida sp. MMG025]MCF6445237.1 cell division protein FtsQ/DivIB [Nereida sp. MMG025]
MQSLKPTTIKRDPAPSKWAYRYQRLKLRPGYRRFMRVGLPLCVTALLAGGYFADKQNRETVQLAIADARAMIEERPEFMVKLMAIDGASGDTAEQIRTVLPVEFPLSSFDLDLAQMRADVEALDAVKSASLLVRAGNVLQVQVNERVPVAVWRHREGLELRDAEGALVKKIASRNDYPHLPLIAGEGAADQITQALDLFAAANPIANRVQGLVRLGDRRWDVVLDTGQRIMLPTDDPVTALERVIILDRAQDMLNRDITVVDMRLGARPTLRMGEAANSDLRRIKAIELGVAQ